MAEKCGKERNQRTGRNRNESYPPRSTRQLLYGLSAAQVCHHVKRSELDPQGNLKRSICQDWESSLRLETKRFLDREILSPTCYRDNHTLCRTSFLIPAHQATELFILINFSTVVTFQRKQKHQCDWKGWTLRIPLLCEPMKSSRDFVEGQDTRWHVRISRVAGSAPDAWARASDEWERLRAKQLVHRIASSRSVKLRRLP